MATVSGVNPLDNLRAKPATTKVAQGKNGMLTQSDFFSLLTKELANQDPTKPVDNNQMISQMTAFSTTDGVSKLNDKFATFASSMSSNQALQASSLVGRSVLVDDNRFQTTEGSSVKGKLVTDKAASNVTIFVENQAGAVVQTVPIGSVKAGKFGFTWDGKLADGSMAKSGVYQFKIGSLVGGTATELKAMTYRKVDSVTLSGSSGQVMLNLNGGNSMALKDVTEVSAG